MPILTQSQIQMYAQSAGLTPADKWAAIAMAESSGNTDVVNSIGCVGLWQINQPVHVGSHPQWTVAWLKDPANNAKAAKVIAGSQGLSAWEAYTGPDGKGSDGPWQKYYKGGTGTADATPALDLNPFGGVGDAVDGLSKIAGDIESAGTWISTPYNWVRIGYVVAGAVLVIMGLGIVANSTIMNSKNVKAATGLANNAAPTGKVLNAAKRGVKKLRSSKSAAAPDKAVKKEAVPE